MPYTFSTPVTVDVPTTATIQADTVTLTGFAVTLPSKFNGGAETSVTAQYVLFAAKSGEAQSALREESFSGAGAEAILKRAARTGNIVTAIEEAVFEALVAASKLPEGSVTEKTLAAVGGR